MRKINYHQPSFWEEKYKQNVCEWYEWLYPSNQAYAFIKGYLPQNKEIKILELGCGTSTLAQKLIGLGYTNITCVDFSKQVIKHRKNKNRLSIKYQHLNIIENFPFEAESFDLIIDKNTIDCIFCFEDYPKKILKCMKQCYRILSNEGLFLSISHGRPKHRKFYFRNKISPLSFKFVKLKIRFNGVQDKKVQSGKQELKKNEENWNYLYICSKSGTYNQDQNEQGGDNYEDQGINQNKSKKQQEQNQNQNDIIDQKENEDEPNQNNQEENKQDENKEEEANQKENNEQSQDQ